MRFRSRFDNKRTEDPAKSESFSQCVALGLCFGVTAGALIGNIGLGISLGICFGAAIGYEISRKQKQSRSGKNRE